MTWTSKRVTVTGGAGFLGREVCRLLKDRGAKQIYIVRRAEYDLTVATDVQRLYETLRPDVVIHLAAEVGGIGANQKQPGRFFYANAMMGLNLIEEARRHAIDKFVQIGTVCAYPKHTPVPFVESSLWNGYPEETNAPYGVAKKALFVMLEAYRTQYGLASSVVVPVNLYGPHDNFDLETSHVIPALIRKCVEAVQRGDSVVPCWGTGSASREFLYVEDAARGVLAAAEKMDEPEPINLGTGQEIRIKELAKKIASACGFSGELTWDASQPDGQPRRCLDTSLAQEKLGWSAQVDFDEGLDRTITWYRSTLST
jgi:GDP-L-fucose synthase